MKTLAEIRQECSSVRDLRAGRFWFLRQWAIDTACIRHDLRFSDEWACRIAMTKTHDARLRGHDQGPATPQGFA